MFYKVIRVTNVIFKNNLRFIDSEYLMQRYISSSSFYLLSRFRAVLIFCVPDFKTNFTKMTRKFALLGL